MKKTEVRRQVIIEQVADYLLVHGIQGSSLRPLAAAIGMSDRMLLHYFADKEELITAALTVVTARLMGMLDVARTEQMPFKALLTYVSGMIGDPQVRPYLRLWLELTALAAEGEGYHRTVARHIYDLFFDWIAAALHVEREDDRKNSAALALATIEGFVLLDALGYGDHIAGAVAGIPDA